MNVTRMGVSVCTLLLAAMVSGCCGGGSTTVQPAMTTVPVGQQLIDLKKAYESGAITEKEYNKLKEDVMENSAR